MPERQAGRLDIGGEAETNEVEQRARIVARRRLLCAHARQPQRAAQDAALEMRVKPDEDIVERGEPAEHLGVLKGARDAASGDRLRLPREQIDTAKRHPASRRAVETGQHVEDRRLAGAIRTNQPVQRAARNIDGQRLDGRQAAETLRHVSGLEQPRR